MKKPFFTFLVSAAFLGILLFFSSKFLLSNSEVAEIEKSGGNLDELTSGKPDEQSDLAQSQSVPNLDDTLDVIVNDRAPVSFKNNEIVREEILKHVIFQPRFVDNDFVGYEIVLDSSEYSLEDFGLLKGDLLTGFGIDSPVKQSTFETILLSNVKYGSVIVKINRNNVEHHVELDLDSLIYER